MSPAVIAGSLVAVLGVAWLAKLLGLGSATRLDEAEALAVAGAEPRFVPVSAYVSDDGQAAVVTGESGAVLLKVHGAKIASRRIASFGMEDTEGGVLIASDDPRWGRVALRLADARRAALHQALLMGGVLADKGVNAGA